MAQGSRSWCWTVIHGGSAKSVAAIMDEARRSTIGYLWMLRPTRCGRFPTCKVSVYILSLGEVTRLSDKAGSPTPKWRSGGDTSTTTTACSGPSLFVLVYGTKDLIVSGGILS